MKTSDRVNARALKLSNVLNGLGHDLKHSDSLDVISKFEGSSHWNEHLSTISEQQRVTEQYLDEILAAIAELDHAKFTRRMNEELLEEFTEKRFLRSIGYLREDLGCYVSRKYMGFINGAYLIESVNKNPDKIRHIWRGVFEDHEVFITLGIQMKNGVQYVRGFNFR